MQHKSKCGQPLPFFSPFLFSNGKSPGNEVEMCVNIDAIIMAKICLMVAQKCSEMHWKNLGQQLILQFKGELA